MSFLKRLFGLGQPDQPQLLVVPTKSLCKSRPSSRSHRLQPCRHQSLFLRTHGSYAGRHLARKYEEAAKIIRQSLDVIETWLKEDIGEYGQFVIGSIPVFEQGGRILAYLGRDADLARDESIAQFYRIRALARHHRRAPRRSDPVRGILVPSRAQGNPARTRPT